MPAIWARTPIAKPPVRVGRPAQAPSASPGSNRFGPRTTPRVVDQTTRDRSRPRLASAARSVAAKRACKFRAAAAPISVNPISSRGKLTKAAAPITISPPKVARTAPVERETRRPRVWARRARGMANSAAPRVPVVAAIPDHAAEPETSTISRAPRLMVAPVPIPPTICPIDRAVTTRRCSCCKSTSTPPA